MGQNIALLTKLKDRDARLWYATQAIQHGWSRKVLEAQIATDLRGREGSALTSFEHALPAADSELVRDAIKDPYSFEFLGLARKAKERPRAGPAQRRLVVPRALAGELSNIVEAADTIYDD
jgi:predicted nuclease of restriction endonuclease-like (RecB) superfamily